MITKFSSAVEHSGSQMTKAQILAARKAAEATASAKVAPLSVEGLDARDAQAHMTAFKSRHSNPNAPDFFYDSEFNTENFINAVLHYRQAGQIQYNSEGFDAVHAKLLAQGFYEPPVRKRGQPAAHRVPDFVPGQNIIGAAPVASEPMSLETAARIVPLDELRAHVRKGNARTQEEALQNASLRNREKAEAANNDREAAKRLPFSELERLVRSNYRVQRPQ